MTGTIRCMFPIELSVGPIDPHMFTLALSVMTLTCRTCLEVAVPCELAHADRHPSDVRIVCKMHASMVHVWKRLTRSMCDPYTPWTHDRRNLLAPHSLPLCSNVDELPDLSDVQTHIHEPHSTDDLRSSIPLVTYSNWGQAELSCCEQDERYYL